MNIRRLSRSLCVLVLLVGCSRRAYDRAESTAVLVRGLEQGDTEALWRYLPDGMKSQLATLVQRIRSQSDRRLRLAADGLVAEAAVALAAQRGRLEAFTPLREGMSPAEDRAAFARGMQAALELSSARGLLEGGDLEGTLDRAGPALLRVLIPALRAGGSSLVVLQRGGQGALTELLVPVQGRWVPRRWVDAWKELTERADVLLDGDALNTNTLQVIRLVNQTRARLPKLTAAADQPSFDKALSLVMGSLSLALKWASTPTS
jgi:hypothetical protein